VREELETALQDVDQEECTFKPALNEKSRSLETSRKAAQDAAREAAVAAAEASQEDFQEASAAFAAAAAAASAKGGGKLPAGNGRRNETLYAHARSMEARRQQRAEGTVQASMAECPFRPTINATSSTTFSDGSSRNPAARRMGEQRFRHLYKDVRHASTRAPAPASAGPHFPRSPPALAAALNGRLADLT
jgi:hypothetical protein